MRYLLLFVPALLLTAQTPAASKKAVDHKALSAVSVAKNFKESGSPTAPVKIEIYTDYECPACRDLYMNTLPSLTSDFVATGKVQLLHRDYPLPQHQYSRLATRFANAAGAIGKYEVVANQLFVSQPEWSVNGNVEAAVAKVLSPTDMEKVKAMVKSDTHLDDTVTTDVAMGNNQDHLTQTPTIVIIAKGKRDVIGGGMPYTILKQYLNQKLAQ
ncbi:MAG TPA: thioredoxin domain-containing protein [Bryobacteraceae bacterium]|jgi:protein-disulfide isomerase|nr:thioredoxin domain-containing protein [Bryobacteraceae bacterium]